MIKINILASLFYLPSQCSTLLAQCRIRGRIPLCTDSYPLQHTELHKRLRLSPPQKGRDGRICFIASPFKIFILDAARKSSKYDSKPEDSKKDSI